MSESPLLSARGLSLERGGRELFTGLDFSALPGRLVLIEGENGAGKTSLLRILAGLSRYGFEGTVERPERLLFIGHQSAVKGLLTPRENLAWHSDGLADCSDEVIEQALQQVGLHGYEDVPAHTLSAGQHRRVNLARLYLPIDVSLWLLDEPFTAIDRQGVARLEDHFAQHIAAGGAIVMTSHQALRLTSGVIKFSLSKGLMP
ncbi:MAG: cytochrome c biogenesis heme-transporting ATPase CcmA [Pseudomonadota bacterium]